MFVIGDRRDYEEKTGIDAAEVFMITGGQAPT
jgi:hypothetical protein